MGAHDGRDGRIMKHQAPAALAVAVTMGLLLTGCSGAGDDDTAPTAPAASSTASEAPMTDAPSSGTGSGGSADGAVDGIRDGVWQVGEAGEVEFAAKDGTLSLTEVRPADGWQQRVADEKADEIEVHFTKGDQEWKFEVESDSNGLQISKELTIRGGDGGDFEVGSAATLTLAVDGQKVSVGDVAPASDWQTVKQDESSDSVELGFRNESTGGTAEFEAEADGSGVKIEITQKLRGSMG